MLDYCSFYVANENNEFVILNNNRFNIRYNTKVQNVETLVRGMQDYIGSNEELKNKIFNEFSDICSLREIERKFGHGMTHVYDKELYVVCKNFEIPGENGQKSRVRDVVLIFCPHYGNIRLKTVLTYRPGFSYKGLYVSKNSEMVTVNSRIS